EYRERRPIGKCTAGKRLGTPRERDVLVMYPRVVRLLLPLQPRVVVRHRPVAVVLVPADKRDEGGICPSCVRSVRPARLPARRLREGRTGPGAGTIRGARTTWRASSTTSTGTRSPGATAASTECDRHPCRRAATARPSAITREDFERRG